MSLTDIVENDVLELIFQAVAWANFADNAAASPITNIEISLHTADPGEAGDQTTSEATYTGYARIPVARTSSGWAVAAGTADNVAVITFGEKTGGGDQTITHFGVGTDNTGAGRLLGSGALTASLLVSNGVTPEFAVGDCNISLN